jgi:NAD(P)-dependent dehydrogenase (short-subunit alcohol dehydrogenase family)
MKIAITGHSYGIGQSLATIYSQYGHKIIGFSRSNGYNISDPVSRKIIVSECHDVDIFFNNAHDWNSEHDFSETKLLTELWESWQNQHRIIANISSSVTMRWEQGKDCSLTYRTAKLALENTCELLWNKSTWPQVSVIAPCLTDTPRTQVKTDNNKADPDEFAKLIYHVLGQTNFRVQILKLALQPQIDSTTQVASKAPLPP